MKFFGYNITLRKDANNGGMDIDTIMRRLHAMQNVVSGIYVNEETCMQSPTVQAIVQGVSRRISTMPVQIMRKSTSRGREKREPLPSHSVARLLNAPNPWQTRMNYWLDATSVLIRYGRFFSYKAQGSTGPIRRLVPLHPKHVEPIVDDDNYDLTYRITDHRGQRTVPYWEVMYARGAARDFVCGDSPINDVKEAIALEIAAEKFGASFFGNGALPFIVFKFLQERKKGFKDESEESAFLEAFHNLYTRGRQHRAFVLPPGMEMSNPVDVSNDKAQFLDTRKLQRSVIAAALGVPPHLAGDLERATYNNVEQQSLDVQIAVILPYAMMFESAMERDLLSEDDRRSGVCVRFNMDAILRGDFKTRQDGLAVQRQWGVISANEWREKEYMNPIEEDWADEQIVPNNFVPGGTEPAEPVGTAPIADRDPPEPPDPKKAMGDDFWEDLRKSIGEARGIVSQETTLGRLRLLRGGKK